MASLAHVEQQDSQYPGTNSATRRSASLYDHFTPGEAIAIDHAFILGSITRRPAGNTSTSLLDEVVIQRGSSDIWSRLEVLQRLRSELEIPTSTEVHFDEERWVAALSIGCTHWFALRDSLTAGLGMSLTMDFLPDTWGETYGGRTPVTVRLIFQMRGSGHWKQ